MPSSRTTAMLACLLLVLAGCSSAPVATTTQTQTTSTTSPPTDTTSPPTDTTTTTPPTTSTTTNPTTTDTTHDRWIRGDVVSVEPHQIAVETSIRVQRLDPDEQTVVRDAVENGSTTVTTVEDAFSGGHYPVVVNGTVYNVTRTQVDSATLTVHEFRLDGPLREGTEPYRTAKNNSVAFDALPAADQQAFLDGIPSGTDLNSSSFAAGYRHYYPDGAAPEDSVIVGEETQYVEYQGHYFQIEFTGTESADRRTYEYTATKVAESLDAYEEIAVDRYVTNASNTSLSPRAQEILLSGIENGSVYYHSENPSLPTHYENFYHWSREHRFVEYEGEYYWLQIMKVME